MIFRSSRYRLLSALTLAATVALAACESEQKPAKDTEDKHGDAGAKASASSVDPNIAKAVKEASQQGQGSGSAGDQQGGPPPTGVFGPGEADRELAKDAAPKITVGSTGGGETVTLQPLLVPPGSKREGQATVGIRMGPNQAMPTVDFAFTLEAPKKADAEGEAAAGPVAITGRFSAARLASEQPGRLPPGLDAQVQKLKGSKVQYALYEKGGAANLVVEPVQGADASLVRELATVTESLPLVHGPFPDGPVGTGAFWMVTTREPFMGFDTVTYRMFRVEKLDAASATLSVKTKRYVAGGSLDLPGLPPSSLAQFESQGEGEMTLSLSDGAIRVQDRQGVLAALASTQDPGQRMTLQLGVNVALAFPGKK